MQLDNLDILDTDDFGMSTDETSALFDNYFGTSSEVKGINKEEGNKTEESTEDIPSVSDKKIKESLSKKDVESAFSDFLSSKDEEDEDDQQEEVTPAEDKDIKDIVEDTPENNEEEEDTEENTADRIRNFSKDLFELGILTNDEGEEEEITTEEELLERLNFEKKKGALQTIENFLSRFGSEYKEAFQEIFINGVNPRTYYQTKNSIDSIEEIDLSDEHNQEEVVRELYRRSGYSEARINKKITGLKELGQLEEEAEEAKNVLLEQEREEAAARLQEEANKQKQRLQAKAYHDKSIQQILQSRLKERSFDGMPLSEKIVAETIDFMTTEKYVLPTGERITEYDKMLLELRKPENYELRIKTGLFLKNKGDLSKVKIQEISNKNKSLFRNTAIVEKPRNKTSHKLKPDDF